jgi:hypothetical protein
MRIAKHWPQIVELGLDSDDVTLEDLRWIRSDSSSESPKARRAASKAKKTGPDLTLEDDLAIAGEEGEYERLSCVFYYRSHMRHRGTPAQELEWAKNRKRGESLSPRRRPRT